MNPRNNQPYCQLLAWPPKIWRNCEIASDATQSQAWKSQRYLIITAKIYWASGWSDRVQSGLCPFIPIVTLHSNLTPDTLFEMRKQGQEISTLSRFLPWVFGRGRGRHWDVCPQSKCRPQWHLACEGNSGFLMRWPLIGFLWHLIQDYTLVVFSLSGSN